MISRSSPNSKQDTNVLLTTDHMHGCRLSPRPHNGSKTLSTRSQSISNNHCIAIFGTPNATVHAPADSLNAQILQFFFFEVATVILLIYRTL